MNHENLEIWKKHKPFVELLSEVNNSYVFVAEICVKYWYLSPNFQFLGYDPQPSQQAAIASGYIETRIHPDDLFVMELMQNKLFAFIQTLPIDQRKDYKHIYECRIRNMEGKYSRYIIQQQILELDSSGKPWLLFGIIDPSPNTSAHDTVNLCIINNKTGEVIPFNRVSEQGNDIKLSKREKEILEMVRQGMLSKEISDQLFLSIHTVNKHRQNIMQKMNTNNLLEAIERARQLGLLD